MERHDSEEVSKAVLDLAVIPLVTRLSEEAKQPIDLRIVVLRSAALLQSSDFSVSSGAVNASRARGEVRILLKGANYPCGFEIEGIFNGLAPGTGFSGFSIRGKAKFDDGKPSVKLLAHSNRYNVWGWSGAFRIP